MDNFFFDIEGCDVIAPNQTELECFVRLVVTTGSYSPLG